MMTTCPNREQLSGYILGLLPEGAVEEIAEHVDQCSACEAAVLTLERTPDTVVSALRQPAPADPVLAEQACRRAIEQIQALAGDSVVDAPPTKSAVETPMPPASEESLEFLAPAKSSDELGRLGSYRVLKKLGAGGMGIVFLAEDIHLKRHVALKILHPEAAAKRSARERFLREAQAAATLEHEHIVTIFQVGEEGGMPYLAMQLLKGMSLEDRLRRAESARPPALLSIPQILRLSRQIARGLAAAHERRLVHRDIKPANLWLEPEHGGHVRILDFGLARPVSEDTHLTQSGTVVGTPSYMAPEQARGKKVDHRCDLFSLGVVLYRMCTGRMPFTGQTTMAVLTSLAVDSPKPIQDLNPAVPSELCDVVMQLLSKDPAKRPASAKEVAERLQALERTLTVPMATPVAIPVQPAAPVNPWADIDVTEPIRATCPESVARPESAKGVPASQPRLSKTTGVPPRRRRRVLVAAFAAAVVILLAGIITIRVAGDKGELVIKADESVEVTIKRNDKPVEDLKLKKGDNIVSVYSGDIEVILKGANADEFLVKNNHITLKRGDKLVVEIERKAVAKSEPRPSGSGVADADRKAAEWVLKIGGVIHIRQEGHENAKVAKDLPTTPFQLDAVILHDNKKVDDFQLERLKGLTNLRWLDLNRTLVGDAGMVHLKGLTNLAVLHLEGTRVSDAGLEHLNGLTNLITLILTGTGISDTGVGKLTGLTKLTVLGICARRVGDAGVAQIKNWRNLEVLDLHGTLVSDDGLEHLRGLTKLSSLQLQGTQVSDRGLEHLKSLTNLQEILLYDTKVTSAAIADLQKALPKCRIVTGDADRDAALWVLSIGGKVFVDNKQQNVITKLADLPKERFALSGVSLEQNQKVTDGDLARFKDCQGPWLLGLSGTKITDAGLVHIKDLPELYLNSTAVTDAGLAHLKNCTGLRQLQVTDTAITDAGLTHLKVMKLMTRLTLHKTKVTEAGVRQLAAALSQCRIEWDGGVIEPKPSADPDRKAAEWVLSIGGEIGIRPAGAVGEYGIRALKDLPSGPFDLVMINLDHNPEVNDDNIEKLKDLPNLVSLNVPGTRVGDSGLSRLKGLPKLSQLHLGDTKVTDAGLVHLKGLTNLTSILLNGLQVTDAGLQHLKGLNKLTTLSLDRCTQVSNGGLQHLRGLTHLTTLRLRETAVTNAGLEHLRSLTELTTLSLVGCPRVSDAGLEKIRGLRNLAQLALNGTGVTDGGLEHLEGLGNITHLYLHDTKVKDAGVERLKGLTNLAQLDLGATQVSDVGLAHLHGMTNLTYLTLDGTQVTDAGLGHLKGLKKLFVLSLIGTGVTNVGLEHLKRLANLQNLNLEGTRVSDAGLAHLVAMPKLSTLNVTNTHISAIGFATLQAAFPWLDKKNWSELNREAAEAVFAIGGSVKLRTNDGKELLAKTAADLPAEYFRVKAVSVAGPITSEEKIGRLLGALRALKDPEFDGLEALHYSNMKWPGWFWGDYVCPTLHEITLTRCEITHGNGLDLNSLKKCVALRRATFDGIRVDKTTIEQLKDLAELSDLSVAGSPIKDEDLEKIAKLTRLRRLVLDGCDICGIGLVNLKELPKLTELHLGCSRLTDLGIKHVVELKGLEKLSLAGSSVSDEGLPHLNGLTGLKELDLTKCKVTAEGVAALQKALPKCKIAWDGNAKNAPGKEQEKQ
jgi:serine/threonine protein kinase/Leucine-rich repeat (LRR) protein